ncbi:tetratricopeptide repeat protein [Candidatus Sumerlaeota bacterium]|nr:tetratricopeptide repeat protein [Candidatus Sumerlaeota bacterium]
MGPLSGCGAGLGKRKLTVLAVLFDLIPIGRSASFVAFATPELMEYATTDDSAVPQPPVAATFKAYHTAPLPKPYKFGEAKQGGRWSALGIAQAIILAALSVYFVAQSSVYWLAVIDDSYITFRFVDMYTHGYGWRFSPEGPRVEGMTNYLWAVALIPPHLLKLDLMSVAKVYGLVCGLFAILGSFLLARAIRNRNDLINLIPAIFLATNAHFSHWAMMGMETLLQVALVVWAYYRFEVERRDHRAWQVSPILCVLAAMTRIDSLYYLSPLGMYGAWLVIWCRIPIKRMLRWAVLAAVPFGIYWVWRWNYFGDLLPNTYYAKQRLVPFEGYGRGPVQLAIFYFDQGGFTTKIPKEFASVAQDSFLSGLGYAAKLGLWLGGDGRNSLAWINLWLCGALLSAAAMVSGAVAVFARRFQVRWLLQFDDVQFGKIAFLVAAPWMMNIFYIYHVNGDWMPSFRFFQIIQPTIGVSLAVGVGFAMQFIGAELGRRIYQSIASLLLFAATATLLFFSAKEQAQTMSVYVFGADGVYWSKRKADWYKPEEIVRGYRMGFSPPLEDVANRLLVETQDDAWVFMSDIGLPLWLAEHLNLYDVDGLTDPFLSHAPSMRGRIPPFADFEEKVRRQYTQADGSLIPGTKEKDLELQAKRAEFEAFLGRNTRYIMEERRPEYLLLFINHERPDPKSPGGAYPEISWRVWKHPALANYTDDWQSGKTGFVFNHVFRRNDVPKEVPDAVKLKRFFRAIDRNPLLPCIVAWMEKESHTMKTISAEDRARIRGHVLHTLKRFPDDEATRKLLASALYGRDAETIKAVLEYTKKQKPDSVATYYLLADAYEKEGNFAEAASIVEKTQSMVEADDNSSLYRLIWLYEKLEREDKVREYGRLAVKRRPDDERPWSDLASGLERLSDLPRYSKAEALAMKREALEAFNKLVELKGSKPDYLEQVMGDLQREIDEATAPPAGPAPATQADDSGTSRPEASASGMIPLPVTLPRYESRYGP